GLISQRNSINRQSILQVPTTWMRERTMVMTSSINCILRRKGVGEKIGPIEEYSETGLIVVRSDQIADTQGLTDAKYCFRWGTTATIPNSAHVESVNEPKDIHWAYDKKSYLNELSIKVQE